MDISGAQLPSMPVVVAFELDGSALREYLLPENIADAAVYVLSADGTPLFSVGNAVALSPLTFDANQTAFQGEYRILRRVSPSGRQYLLQLPNSLANQATGQFLRIYLLIFLAALVVGALAQKSRLCMVGGLRDAVMLGDFHLLYGFAAIFVVTLVGNLAMNRFNLGFALQPIAHSAHVWNLLGMVLVGWGSVLLGGCPLRQLILAAQGNGDSAVTVFGMIVGAALAHNFGLAGNPDSKNEAGQLVVGGISTAGKVAVIVGLVVLLVIAMWNMPKKETTK